MPVPPCDSIRLDKYVPELVRRQLIKTLLMVMREYSYCSIANQFCIMIMDQTKTLFDVVDVVQLQQFVIREFRERHQALLDFHKSSKEKGITVEFKRYRINHLNMQSAQVNQMTHQLKGKIESLRKFYAPENEEMAV